ncbi:cell surface glycoprotein CD200 receptor 1 isoform X2 [Sciurus carolinensis]|uniref:cell surface glycoprotein CD200 receptor 1 isoform X2 n=1 Tax=Sciurus carolinensis TaxID=30640 RepID=UPI001FB2E679|nr:cell surface glycoprotein CD200 receptor 1 isoform X2 [Sciurus carolinensis]
MLCPCRTHHLRLLLMLTVFFLADSSSPCMDEKQTTLSPTEVNTSQPVQTGEKVVLCCPFIPPSRVLVIVTWQIVLRDKPLCSISYKRETNETLENNCTDGRITWASRPDQSPHLQIHPVAVSHEGNYRCQMATIDGNFEHNYHLQVLVPPEVTVFPEKNRTVVCQAVAGRPAAQIFWTPEGDCAPEKQDWVNGTVTTRSTCHYPDGNVSTVTCFVSHPTGNRSLSTDLLPGAKGSEKLYYLFIIIPVILIIGFIWFLKISGYRKCKLKKTEATTVVEEDEMQPYASYAEKNNPLYDTVNNLR